MANYGPIKLFRSYTGLRTLSDLTSFVSAFAEDVTTQFNGLISTRSICGVVGATGMAVRGDGFGSSHVGTGQYFISFQEKFSGAPYCISLTGLGFQANGYVSAAGATGFVAALTNSAGSAFDATFYFDAKGPR